MAQQFQIRKLTESDALSWAAIRMEALKSHPLAFGSSAPDDIHPLVDRFLNTVGEPETSAIFGAFQDGQLVGTAGINRNTGPKEQHKAFIWGVYVAHQARRKGIAEKLLRTAITHAHDWQGVELIQLTVSDAAPAARLLYEELGFQEWGVEPRALCYEGRYAAEAHMFLTLG